MGQHHPPLCLHIEAPQEVKQEVPETDYHDGGVKLGVFLPEVAERPGTDNNGRDETQTGRKGSMDGSDDSTVPLCGAPLVEQAEEEVEVGPEQETAQHCQTHVSSLSGPAT